METRVPIAPNALARRLRMAMGDQRVSRSKLSKVTGISRPSLATKLDGRVEFTYAELVAVIEALGLAWEELLDPTPAADEPVVKLRNLAPRPDRRL